jgi:hypothetical protein
MARTVAASPCFVESGLGLGFGALATLQRYGAGLYFGFYDIMIPSIGTVLLIRHYDFA